MSRIRVCLSMLLFVACSVLDFTLASCADVVSSLVEYDMQKGVNNAKPSKGTSQKARDKEAEQLKKEGKCPACRGMGKTPDGRYTCTECNGTGVLPQKDANS